MVWAFVCAQPKQKRRGGFWLVVSVGGNAAQVAREEEVPNYIGLFSNTGSSEYTHQQYMCVLRLYNQMLALRPCQDRALAFRLVCVGIFKMLTQNLANGSHFH